MKVFIVGAGVSYADMFRKRGWEVLSNKATSMLEADLVQFTGGEDVTPEIYGEKNTDSYNDLLRDVFDAGYFAIAKRMGKPMAGICRGGQFLNVMCGGSMIQHVKGHAISGTHLVRDHRTNNVYSVTSTHHQMMLCDPAYADIVATANIVGEFDQEVLYYHRDKILCFQPHPEFNGYEDCTNYYFELLDRYLELRS